MSQQTEQLLRDLRSIDPWVHVEYLPAAFGAVWLCKFCNAWTRDSDEREKIHAPTCVWLRADVLAPGVKVQSFDEAVKAAAEERQLLIERFLFGGVVAGGDMPKAPSAAHDRVHSLAKRVSEQVQAAENAAADQMLRRCRAVLAAVPSGAGGSQPDLNLSELLDLEDKCTVGVGATFAKYARALSERESRRARSKMQTELHQAMRQFFAEGLTRDDLISLLGNEIILVLNDGLRQFVDAPPPTATPANSGVGED